MNRLILLDVKCKAALVKDAEKEFQYVVELKQILRRINFRPIEISIRNAHHEFEDVEKDKLLLVNLDGVVIQLAVHQRLEEWPRIIILSCHLTIAGSNQKILRLVHVIEDLVECADGNTKEIARRSNIPNNLMLHNIQKLVKG